MQYTLDDMTINEYGYFSAWLICFISRSYVMSYLYSIALVFTLLVNQIQTSRISNGPIILLATQ